MLHALQVVYEGKAAYNLFLSFCFLLCKLLNMICVCVCVKRIGLKIFRDMLGVGMQSSLFGRNASLVVSRGQNALQTLPTMNVLSQGELGRSICYSLL